MERNENYESIRLSIVLLFKQFRVVVVFLSSSHHLGEAPGGHPSLPRRRFPLVGGAGSVVLFAPLELRLEPVDRTLRCGVYGLRHGRQARSRRVPHVLREKVHLLHLPLQAQRRRRVPQDLGADVARDLRQRVDEGLRPCSHVFRLT